VFYEFLMSFYDIHVSETSYFWSAKKIARNSHSELESFVDLVGGVSSGEAALARAEPLAQRFQERSAELVTAVDKLVADKERSMLPLVKSSIVRAAMQESAQVQAQAQLGEDAEAEPPLFENGLVPSADGMFWSRFDGRP
jgi:halogenation protein CepH